MKTSLNIRMNQGFTPLGESSVKLERLKLKRFLLGLGAIELPSGPMAQRWR
jgi:hypothetical protein